MRLTSFQNTVIPANWKRQIRELSLPLFLNHVFGPSQIRLADNEAAVTCVLKNGEFYMEPFINHYMRMGFRHIFFLDNGSSDKTIEIAKTHKNVTVYDCKLRIEAYQASLKRHLAKRTIRGGWCLDVDIDEFFDYPYSDGAKLQRFLEYLNSKHYTAVITQMLDMFSDKPLSYLSRGEREDLKEVHRYYDISGVRKERYGKSALALSHARENKLPDGNVMLYFGGIRKSLYGIDPLLTKHSLFRSGIGLELFPHVHFVNRASIADVSCLLLHYNSTSNTYKAAFQNKNAFFGTSKGYSDLLDQITKRPDYRIKQETAAEFRSADDLVKSNFLFASDDYRTFAKLSAE